MPCRRIAVGRPNLSNLQKSERPGNGRSEYSPRSALASLRCSGGCSERSRHDAATCPTRETRCCGDFERTPYAHNLFSRPGTSCRRKSSAADGLEERRRGGAEL